MLLFLKVLLLVVTANTQHIVLQCYRQFGVTALLTKRSAPLRNTVSSPTHHAVSTVAVWLHTDLLDDAAVVTSHTGMLNVMSIQTECGAPGCV
jgi:hypothetical protein